MNIFAELTIVTSCAGYGKYLDAWATSISRLTRFPRRVVIVTHGSPADAAEGVRACSLLLKSGVDAFHEHSVPRLDFGVARNRAVAHAQTEWVMHLDADDRIMPHALDDVMALAPGADVISFGYERSGDLKSGPSNKTRIYRDGNGLAMLDHAAPCSGVSPFRRHLWEQSPYRTDMKGAWDTALWIGFARLGARFRATKRPCFWYTQHADSIFNRRRLTFDWTHVHTGAKLKSLRRNDSGVAVIVPRDLAPSAHRVLAWNAVQKHLALHHAEWPIFTGVSDSRRWIKGEAIASAIAQSTAEILVISDADVVVQPSALIAAVDAVRDGAAWAIPHEYVNRVSKAMTPRWASYLEQGEWHLPGEDCMDRAPYIGYAGGGIVIVRRFLYDAVGGIPRVFEGWGGEDQALAVILDSLLGKHWRGKAELIHLWHESQPTKKTHIQNSRRFRLVRQEAAKGPTELWNVLQALLTGKRPIPTRLPKWKRIALGLEPPTNHGVGLSARQGYLGRKRRTP